MDEIYEFRDLKFQEAARYDVKNLTGSTGILSNASSAHLITLFSMQNPQTSVIFRGLLALLAVEVLIFVLEVTIELKAKGTMERV